MCRSDGHHPPREANSCEVRRFRADTRIVLGSPVAELRSLLTCLTPPRLEAYCHAPAPVAHALSSKTGISVCLSERMGAAATPAVRFGQSAFCHVGDRRPRLFQATLLAFPQPVCPPIAGRVRGRTPRRSRHTSASPSLGSPWFSRDFPFLLLTLACSNSRGFQCLIGGRHRERWYRA
jgi:hypothetical protein